MKKNNSTWSTSAHMSSEQMSSVNHWIGKPSNISGRKYFLILTQDLNKIICYRNSEGVKIFIIIVVSTTCVFILYGLLMYVCSGTNPSSFFVVASLPM